MNEKQVEALNTIINVCASHVGNLQDHRTIQASINVIKEAMSPKPEEKESESLPVE
jgi:hypothetical protein